MAGYKSGALNFALTKPTRAPRSSAPSTPITSLIRLSYMILSQPSLIHRLRLCRPRRITVISPETLTWKSTYHGYKYFFEVSMPTRNEQQPLSTPGTMGLIRKIGPAGIGGWTSGASPKTPEASSRIPEKVYQFYSHRVYGRFDPIQLR